MALGLTSNSYDQKTKNLCCCLPNIPEGNVDPYCCANYTLNHTLNVYLYGFENLNLNSTPALSIGTFNILPIEFQIFLDENNTNNFMQTAYNRVTKYGYYGYNIPLKVNVSLKKTHQYTDGGRDFLLEQLFSSEESQFLLDFYLTCGPQPFANSNTQIRLVIKQYNSTNYWPPNGNILYLQDRYLRQFYAGWLSPFETIPLIKMNCEPYLAYANIISTAAYFSGDGEFTTVFNPLSFNGSLASYTLKSKLVTEQNYNQIEYSFFYYRPTGSMKVIITE